LVAYLRIICQACGPSESTTHRGSLVCKYCIRLVSSLTTSNCFKDSYTPPPPLVNVLKVQTSIFINTTGTHHGNPTPSEKSAFQLRFDLTTQAIQIETHHNSSPLKNYRPINQPTDQPIQTCATRTDTTRPAQHAAKSSSASSTTFWLVRLLTRAVVADTAATFSMWRGRLGAQESATSARVRRWL
jgi:hypothetical protein